jgi:hypothetical protein
MESLKQILTNRPPDKRSYSKHEFQDFGYRIAEQLNDISHKSLYIKLAKTVERNTLLDALEFVKGTKAKSPARLFMWKLKELRYLSSQQVQKPKANDTSRPEEL